MTIPPNTELREAMTKILQQQWAAAYKAGQNGKMLAQLITEPIIEDAVLNKLTALFQAHQQELLSELLDEMHPYRTIESMRFLIERKMGELNG